MTIVGEVVEGRRLGRELGFPTANVAIDKGCEVDNGVYRSRIRVGDRWYNGVTNIGTNPTVGETERRAESYILDFNKMIYGERIEIELVEKIRDEQQFETLDQLRDQIARDINSINTTK